LRVNFGENGAGHTACHVEIIDSIPTIEIVKCRTLAECDRATAAAAMSRIAIVEKLNGKAFDWMEQVSDEQYQAVLY
jgi:hypothetical protein